MAIFNHLLSFHSWSEDGNLFPTKKEHTPDEILQRVSGINQFAFYGRCMGFQYHDSIKPVLKFISISMAGYSESYFSKNSTLIKATNSMFTTGKYFLDPELRSRRIVNLSNNASIDFCKVVRIFLCQRIILKIFICYHRAFGFWRRINSCTTFHSWTIA